MNCDEALYRIVDITVYSSFRGQGIGTGVITFLQGLCDKERAAIALRVVKTNPALRLYARLGFQAADESDLDMQMLWKSKGYEQKEEHNNV
ncbi:Acetyltransferase (GNAT) family protein [compost metagenome]